MKKNSSSWHGARSGDENYPFPLRMYRGAGKSLARPGRKQATAREDLSFIYPIYNHSWRNISTIYIYIYIYKKKQD